MKKRISIHPFLQATLLYLLVPTLLFATRWSAGKKMLFEVLWDPIPIYFFYPGDQLAISTLKQGEFPLWDPYRALGTHLDIPFLSHLYPLKLFAMALNSIWAWECYLLLRFFFAGFFCYVFARKGLNLSHRSSLLSGFSYMLCGYFREYHNFLYLNSEILTPLLLFCVLKIVNKPAVLNFVFATLCMFLITIGDQPEVVFYIILLSFAFTVYLSLLKIIQTRARSSVLFVNIYIYLSYAFLAHLLASYGYLPFTDFFFRSWSFHSYELGSACFSIRHLIALATPIFDYFLSPEQPVHLAQFKLIPAYLGLWVFSLGIFGILKIKNASQNLVFFYIVFFILAGIIFGIPGFKVFSTFPLVRILQNFRYLQPYIALSFSLVAGFGLAELEKKKSFIFFIILLVLFSWVFYHILIFSKEIKTNTRLEYAIILLAGLSVLALGYGLLENIFSFNRAQTFFPQILLFICILELSLYFVLAYPLYGPSSYSISVKAPLLNELKKDSTEYRFYSPQKELIHPNLCSLYEIRDIREQTQLYLKSYIQLFSKLNNWKNEEDIIHSFLKDGKFYFPIELELASKKILDLLSIKYIISIHRLGCDTLLSMKPLKIVAQSPGYLSLTNATIQNKTRKSILLHPPAKIEYKYQSSPLTLELAMEEKAFSEPSSDGSWFLVIEKHNEAKSSLMLSRFLGPSHNPSRWREFMLEAKNKAEVFCFITLPGSFGDSTRDYSRFGSLEFCKTHQDLSLTRDDVAFIYKRKDALPRYRLIKKTRTFENDAQVLDRMSSSEFLPEDELLLVGNEKEAQDNLDCSGDVQLIKDTPNQVIFKTQTQGECFLLLSDIYYPGWKAEIDKNEIKIERADYLLRAVKLKEGSHTLKIYYKPLSFQIGLWVSLSSACTLFFAFLLRKRNFSSVHLFDHAQEKSDIA